LGGGAVLDNQMGRSADDRGSPVPDSSRPFEFSAPAIEFLDALLAPVMDALVTVDENEVITYASPALRRLTGFEPHTVVGRSARDLLDPSQATDTLDAARRPSGPRDVGHQVRLRESGGGFREVVAISRPSRVGERSLLSIVLRGVDDHRHTLDGLRQRLAFEDLLTRVASSFIAEPFA